MCRPMSVLQVTGVQFQVNERLPLLGPMEAEAHALLDGEGRCSLLDSITIHLGYHFKLLRALVSLI